MPICPSLSLFHSTIQTPCPTIFISDLNPELPFGIHDPCTELSTPVYIGWMDLTYNPPS
jgi:hypothetical protein